MQGQGLLFIVTDHSKLRKKLYKHRKKVAIWGLFIRFAFLTLTLSRKQNMSHTYTFSIVKGKYAKMYF